MSDQFPTRAHPLAQPPPFSSYSSGTQLSGYFGQSSDDDNPFASLGPAALPAVPQGPPSGGLQKQGGNDKSTSPDSSTSYKETTTMSGPGFFDSLRGQGQQHPSSAFGQATFTAECPQENKFVGQQLFPSNTGSPGQSVGLLQTGLPVSSGTGGLFASTTQHNDFFSSFQPQPSSRGDVMVPTFGKSPSAPPTGLLEVLPPSDQKPSSCPSTGVIHILSGTELPESPSVPLVEPSPTMEYPSSGHPSLSSGHPSLSSGLPSLSSESHPPGSLLAMATEHHSNIGSGHPSLTGLDRHAHTNVESNVSSPHSRPPSNADSHARMLPYNEPFLGTFQQQTNADPSFNTSSTRGGLRTNLQSDVNPSSQVSKNTAMRTDDIQPPQSTSEPPSSIATAPAQVSSPVTEVVEKPGQAGEETERPPSTTSSLNHSICSLLDSQEDFTSNSSPVRLLAPAPYTHEPFPPVGLPTSLMGEVPLGALSLAPPAPLPAPVTVTSTGVVCSTAGSMVTSPATMQEPLILEQQDAVEQKRAMSNNGTVRLLAEASADENIGEKGPFVVEAGKSSRAGASMSPDSGSKGEGSLNDWEIVDNMAESAIPPGKGSGHPLVSQPQVLQPPAPPGSTHVLAPRLSEVYSASPSVEPHISTHSHGSVQQPAQDINAGITLSHGSVQELALDTSAGITYSHGSVQQPAQDTSVQQPAQDSTNSSAVHDPSAKSLPSDMMTSDSNMAVQRDSFSHPISHHTPSIQAATPSTQPHSEAPPEHHMFSGMHAQPKHEPNTFTTAGNMPAIHTPLQSTSQQVPAELPPVGQTQANLLSAGLLKSQIDHSHASHLANPTQSADTQTGYQHMSSASASVAQHPVAQSLSTSTQALSVQSLPQATSSVTAPTSSMNSVDIPPLPVGFQTSVNTASSESVSHAAFSVAPQIPTMNPQISSAPPQIPSAAPPNPHFCPPDP